MAAPDWSRIVPACVLGTDKPAGVAASVSGERSDVRGAQERMEGQLRRQGVEPERAAAIAQRSAVRYDRNNPR